MNGIADLLRAFAAGRSGLYFFKSIAEHFRSKRVYIQHKLFEKHVGMKPERYSMSGL